MDRLVNILLDSRRFVDEKCTSDKLEALERWSPREHCESLIMAKACNQGVKSLLKLRTQHFSTSISICSPQHFLTISSLAGAHFWLIYSPRHTWLKSPGSCFGIDMAWTVERENSFALENWSQYCHTSSVPRRVCVSCVHFHSMA